MEDMTRRRFLGDDSRKIGSVATASRFGMAARIASSGTAAAGLVSIGAECPPVTDTYYQEGLRIGEWCREGIFAVHCSPLTWLGATAMYSMSQAHDIAEIFTKARNGEIDNGLMEKTMSQMPTYGHDAVNAMKQELPHMYNRFLGIIDGSVGSIFRDIVFWLSALSHRSTMMPLVSEVGFPGLGGGCTALALKGGITEDGLPISIKKFDFTPGIERAEYVTYNMMEGVATSVDAGVAGTTGCITSINKYGVTATLNMAFGNDVNGVHLPMEATLQSGMEKCKTSEELRQYLFGFQNAGYWLCLINDKEGDIILVESTPLNKFYHRTDKQYQIMPNHFQIGDHPGAVPFGELSDYVIRSTVNRLDYVQREIDAAISRTGGNVSNGDLVTSFSRWPVHVTDMEKVTVSTNYTQPNLGKMHWTQCRPTIDNMVEWGL
ncbi:MAG: hypothetical protein ABII01_01800 [Candidatus Woesearchaeota archaeon]